jgi:hypothetical protein
VAEHQAGYEPDPNETDHALVWVYTVGGFVAYWPRTCQECGGRFYTKRPDRATCFAAVCRTARRRRQTRDRVRRHRQRTATSDKPLPVNGG